MSWQRIEVEGRVMWQRSDGVTLPSTDAVAAYEEHERRSFSKQVSTSEQEEIPEHQEPPTLQEIVWVVIALLALLLAAHLLDVYLP